MDAHGNFCMLMVIGAEDPGKVINKLETWKTKMKTNMDMNRNMVMISGPELDLLQDPGKYSCSVCGSISPQPPTVHHSSGSPFERLP